MRRLIVGAAVLAVSAALVVSPPASTLASWLDREQSTGGFTALKVLAPTFTSCVLTTGLLGADPVVTVTWTMPAGYTVANVKVGTYNSVTSAWTDVTASPQVVRTGTSPHFTTKFSSGLLTGLLGGSITLGMMTTHSSGWTSGWQSATASAALLGINPQCTINPAP